jgi:hypothetical protein
MWGAKKIESGAWYYCMRSGIRMNLDDALWEQGRLISPEFSDILAGGAFGLLGSREADIARRVKQNISDLQPHPKLSNPNEPDQDVYFD